LLNEILKKSEEDGIKNSSKTKTSFSEAYLKGDLGYNQK
jgi:hypothetical protein